jgi:hypothetical protein
LQFCIVCGRFAAGADGIKNLKEHLYIHAHQVYNAANLQFKMFSSPEDKQMRFLIVRTH